MPGKNQQSFSGEVEELADEVFFVAASPAMRKIRSQAALVAGVDIPVLMLGESGTGKEVVARLIHKLSPRAHRTFLKVNCAAVPADLAGKRVVRLRSRRVHRRQPCQARQI